MSLSGIKTTTADRLRQFLAGVGEPDAKRHGRPRGPSRSGVLVRCTSTTPAGGSGLAATLYPGKIVPPNSADAVPADDLAVWLTCLGLSGAVAPQLNRVYPAELCGDADGGGGAPSPAVRPRAVAGWPGGYLGASGSGSVSNSAGTSTTITPLTLGSVPGDGPFLGTFYFSHGIVTANGGWAAGDWVRFIATLYAVDAFSIRTPLAQDQRWFWPIVGGVTGPNTGYLTAAGLGTWTGNQTVNFEIVMDSNRNGLSFSGNGTIYAARAN